jgi:hypothetical protein
LQLRNGSQKLVQMREGLPLRHAAHFAPEVVAQERIERPFERRVVAQQVYAQRRKRRRVRDIGLSVLAEMGPNRAGHFGRSEPNLHVLEATTLTKQLVKARQSPRHIRKHVSVMRGALRRLK